MTDINRFNDHLDKFIDMLDKLDICVGHTKLSTYKLFLSNLRVMNVRKPVEIFKQYVYPFKTEIMKGNDQFFLELNYGSDVGGDENSMMKALALKEIWKSDKISSKQKDIIKKYIQALILLSERC